MIFPLTCVTTTDRTLSNLDEIRPIPHRPVASTEYLISDWLAAFLCRLGPNCVHNALIAGRPLKAARMLGSDTKSWHGRDEVSSCSRMGKSGAISWRRHLKPPSGCRHKTAPSVPAPPRLSSSLRLQCEDFAAMSRDEMRPASGPLRSKKQPNS